MIQTCSHFSLLYDLLYYRDAIVGQVLDELGLQIGDELSGMYKTMINV